MIYALPQAWGMPLPPACVPGGGDHGPQGAGAEGPACPHSFFCACPIFRRPPSQPALPTQETPLQRASGPSPVSAGCRSCRCWPPCWSSRVRSASPLRRWRRACPSARPRCTAISLARRRCSRG